MELRIAGVEGKAMWPLTPGPGGKRCFLSGHSLDDTWIWDGKAKKWTQLHPVHNPSTTGLMAYDEADKQVLPFGGGTLTETWTWDGVSRTRLRNSPHTPHL